MSKNIFILLCCILIIAGIVLFFCMVVILPDINAQLEKIDEDNRFTNYLEDIRESRFRELQMIRANTHEKIQFLQLQFKFENRLMELGESKKDALLAASKAKKVRGIELLVNPEELKEYENDLINNEKKRENNRINRLICVQKNRIVGLLALVCRIIITVTVATLIISFFYNVSKTRENTQKQLELLEEEKRKKEVGTELCENCGRIIGKLQQAFVYKEHIVCKECDEKLIKESKEKDYS